MTGEFPTQKRASNTENVSIWLRHNGEVVRKLNMSLIIKYPERVFSEQTKGQLLLKKINYETMTRAWIQNQVYFFMFDVTTHPRPNLNGGLTRFVITAPYFERI